MAQEMDVDIEDWLESYEDSQDTLDVPQLPSVFFLIKDMPRERVPTKNANLPVSETVSEMSKASQEQELANYSASVTQVNHYIEDSLNLLERRSKVIFEKDFEAFSPKEMQNIQKFLQAMISHAVKVNQVVLQSGEPTSLFVFPRDPIPSISSLQTILNTRPKSRLKFQKREEEKFYRMMQDKYLTELREVKDYVITSILHFHAKIVEGIKLSSGKLMLSSSEAASAEHYINQILALVEGIRTLSFYNKLHPYGSYRKSHPFYDEKNILKNIVL